VAKPKIEQQQRASAVDLPTAEAAPGEDDALTAREAAEFCGLALPSFWRQIRDQWLPAPFYSAPRAPRWRRGELRRACDARRQMPRVQKEQRRLARETAAAESTESPAPRL
jgi:predicted DNA-binding transcriptional regulator AlpA